MIDVVRKSIYAAVGLAVMTREKVEEVAGKISKEAKMSEVEGRQFVDDLVKKSEETKAAIEEMVNNRVEDALKKINISSRKELLELEKRVARLEAESISREKK